MSDDLNPCEGCFLPENCSTAEILDERKNLEIEHLKEPVSFGDIQAYTRKDLKQIKRALIYESKWNKEIHESKKHMLGLRDDEITFTEDFIDEAITIAKNFSDSLIGSDMNIETVIPAILPVPDGTIDVRWENQGGKLLINISNALNEPPCYFGKLLDGNTIKGTIFSDTILPVILLWLELFL